MVKNTRKRNREERPNPIREVIEYILGYKDDIDDEVISSLSPAVVFFLYNMFIKYPRIIRFINTWYNHLYDNFDLRQLIDNLRYIAQHYQLDRNKIHVPRASDRTYKQKIYNFIEHLFEFPLSDIEKAFYYYYLTHYTTEEFQAEINNLINDNIKSTKIDNDEQILKLVEEYRRKIYNIETISKLHEYILELKNKEYYCKNCPLLNRDKLVDDEKDVILDSNVDDVDDVRILFIGINPGIDEVKVGKPFVGKSGQLLRQMIDTYISDKVGYAITNAILCATHNQDELKVYEKKITKQCKYRDEIIKHLPNLKLLVLIGDIPKNAFGVKGRITKIAGEIIKYNNNVDIICMPHPSAILRGSKASTQAWERAWKKLADYIESIVTTSSNTTDTKEHHIITVFNAEQKEIHEINNLLDIPENYTLFDIRVLENQNKYLVIMIDEFGNKHYYLLPFKFTFYISNGIRPQECRYFEDIKNLIPITIDKYDELMKLRSLKLKQLQELIEKASE